ncbi:MAG: hypothetical protein PVH61_42390 [Candidatus Aminicenantes bacterium]|jgi:hypothetical protein
MSNGNLIASNSREVIELHGSTIIIHKNFGKDNHMEIEHKGIRNSKKSNSKYSFFDFADQIDIEIGDLLQQKKSRDLWEVVDVCDEVFEDVFSHLSVKVKKFNPKKRILQRNAIQKIQK